MEGRKKVTDESEACWFVIGPPSVLSLMVFEASDQFFYSRSSESFTTS